jgi:membrane-associated phospholipid phosphatase
LLLRNILSGAVVDMEKRVDNLLKKTIVAAVISVIIYLALFFYFDRAIDLWVYRNLADTEVFQAGTALSAAVTGSYIRLALALTLILVVIIDPRLKRRWTRNLLFICLSCSVALIIGEGLKYLLGRHRPVMLFENNQYGLTFFSEQGAQHSSPSGHTLRAFSILTALSLLYRRLTPVCIFLAILIGASRVVVTAHYPSDVLFGAFIGIFSALWTYRYFFEKEEAGKRT